MRGFRPSSGILTTSSPRKRLLTRPQIQPEMLRPLPSRKLMQSLDTPLLGTSLSSRERVGVAPLLVDYDPGVPNGRKTRKTRKTVLSLRHKHEKSFLCQALVFAACAIWILPGSFVKRIGFYHPSTCSGS